MDRNKSYLSGSKKHLVIIFMILSPNTFGSSLGAWRFRGRVIEDSKCCTQFPQLILR